MSSTGLRGRCGPCIAGVGQGPGADAGSGMNSAVSQIGDAAVQPVRAMRPERVAALSIAVLTLAGWLALALEAMRQGSGIDAFVKAICRPVGLDRPLDPAGLWSQFTLTAGFWVAMTLAMMLPTAAPMALSYAERAGRGELGTRAVSPLVLVAGYLTVWFGREPARSRAPDHRRHRMGRPRRSPARGHHDRGHGRGRGRALSVQRLQARLPELLPSPDHGGRFGNASIASRPCSSSDSSKDGVAWAAAGP